MQVHGYPYSDRASTFILEMHEDVWHRTGFGEIAGLAGRAGLAPGRSDEASIELIRGLCADVLGGPSVGKHSLVGNNSRWTTFTTVRCRTWRHENVVLLGDAAHTAHFSIGSGTKLAMEDALALAACLHERVPGEVAERLAVRDALAAYEAERRPVVASTQRAAQASLEWFENIGQYADQDPRQFAFNIVTRSGPSAVPYTARSQTPRELSPVELDEICGQFVLAAQVAARADFDLLELHCAHGYLLSSFLSPLTNQRIDRYGGSLAARLRYPLEVFERGPGDVAAGPADDGADLRDRLVRRRPRPRRRGGDRPGVRRTRRRRDRRVDRAGGQRRAAGLRPQLPDAVAGRAQAAGRTYGGPAAAARADPGRGPADRARPLAAGQRVTLYHWASGPLARLCR